MKYLFLKPCFSLSSIFIILVMVFNFNVVKADDLTMTEFQECVYNLGVEPLVSIFSSHLQGNKKVGEDTYAYLLKNEISIRNNINVIVQLSAGKRNNNLNIFVTTQRI